MSRVCVFRPRLYQDDRYIGVLRKAVSENASCRSSPDDHVIKRLRHVPVVTGFLQFRATCPLRVTRLSRDGTSTESLPPLSGQASATALQIGAALSARAAPLALPHSGRRKSTCAERSTAHRRPPGIGCVFRVNGWVPTKEVQCIG